MILVTGATGTVGTEVVKHLVGAGQKVRVLARNPAKAAKFSDTAEVVEGDLARPETLDAAFAGVEKAFVLAADIGLTELESNAFDAAKKAEVKHIVKLSAERAGMEPEIQIGRWHRLSELKLQATGSSSRRRQRPSSIRWVPVAWASTRRQS